RTIIRHTQRAVDQVAPLMPGDIWAELYARYNDDELRTVLDFTERSSAAVQNLIDRIAQT
ncbi:hypothetical protein ACFQ1S_17640, partial [Kibdelosporangium lantanae]